jgi:hypothetical protein
LTGEFALQKDQPGMQTAEQATSILEQPLDYPGLARRHGAREQVRIWRTPAFDPEGTWAIITHQDDWFARRVIHARQGRGGEIFRDTFGSEGPLPKSDAMALIEGLKAISVAPFVDNGTWGLDGATYGIAMMGMGGFHRVSFSWWCRAPVEWHPLRDWYLSAITMLQRYLPASSVPLQAHHPWVG